MEARVKAAQRGSVGPPGPAETAQDRAEARALDQARKEAERQRTENELAAARAEYYQQRLAAQRRNNEWRHGSGAAGAPPRQHPADAADPYGERPMSKEEKQRAHEESLAKARLEYFKERREVRAPRGAQGRPVTQQPHPSVRTAP